MYRAHSGPIYNRSSRSKEKGYSHQCCHQACCRPIHNPVHPKYIHWPAINSVFMLNDQKLRKAKPG